MKTTIYQIENLKSGRKVKVTNKGYSWGCDCGKDGSFFTLDEALNAEIELGIQLDIQEYGDSTLIAYQVERKEGNKKTKKKQKSNREEDI